LERWNLLQSKQILIGLTILLFVGCQKNELNIYKELKFSERDVENNPISFLNNVKSNGISYEKDQLTPDLDNGKLFGNYNLNTIFTQKYFVYSENKTFDHRISIEISLSPKILIYYKTYIDKQARISQIEKHKEHPKKQEPIENKDIVIDIVETGKPKVKPQFNDTGLGGLLPPRLPDLSIGVDNPDLPPVKK
jgi:hypothetical protein